MPASRPYLYYGQTQSLCETCLTTVPAKIIFQDDKVYYLKRCPEHGQQRSLISTDIPYFKRCKEYLKPGDMPNTFQSTIDKGCPYDCGLCPDHEQHTCLAIFNIIDECNLRCPVCFTNSAPGHGNPRSMADIEAMLNTLLASELEPDLVQVSGGEPTLHPGIIAILTRLKESPIRHLMLNTNGLRIANDPDFVTELAKIKTGFEVYLQFDSLQASSLKNIRGADLRTIRQRALEQLERHNISTTLVCVIRKGVNDSEIADLIDYARQWQCVRGVTFQPVQDVGRNQGHERNQRITLSEIRRAIVEADNPFSDEDMIPLPCHPENISIGYGIKLGDEIHPVTGLLPRDELLKGTGNTITFEKDQTLKTAFNQLYSLDACGEQTLQKLQTLLCCLPKIDAPSLSYENVFRVVITSFLDQYNFCTSSVKRSCIHFVEPNGKIFPIDTRYLLHADK
ncbi:radical SAM protein [Pseudomonadota bacterium]